MWLDVDVEQTPKKTLCLRQIRLHVESTLTILSSVVNMIGETYITTDGAQDNE